jgi:intergrase/recombinase
MARAVSVKIPTAKVIEMIEQKIASITEDVETYPARKAEYRSAYKAYTEQVVARLGQLIAQNGSALLAEENTDKGIRVSTNYRNAVEITIGKELLDLVKPEEPTDPEPKGYYSRNSYSTKRDELEKTLRLLRMTEQETITSSTYNSVLELL